MLRVIRGIATVSGFKPWEECVNYQIVIVRDFQIDIVKWPFFGLDHRTFCQPRRKILEYDP